MTKSRVTLRVYMCMALLAASFGLGGSADALLTPTRVAGIVTPTTLGQLLPSAIANTAIDSTGRIAIATGAQIYIADTNGTLTLLAGDGNFGFFGDGGPATSAQLGSPAHMHWDGAGNLYFVDSGSRVRKVTASTGIISTVAGNGNFPFTAGEGDGGPAVSAPLIIDDIAVDSARNIFIPDSLFGLTARVRKVNASNGVITTWAGGDVDAGCPAGTGAATGLTFDSVDRAATAANGDVYIAVGCGAAGTKILRINANGTFGAVVAGGGTFHPGNGRAATTVKLGQIWGLSVVGSDVYALEQLTNTVTTLLRKVSGGIITGLSGTGGCDAHTGDALLIACVSQFDASAGGMVVAVAVPGSAAFAKVVAGNLQLFGAPADSPHDGQTANQVPIAAMLTGLAAKPDGTLFFSAFTESFAVRSIAKTTGIVGTKAGVGTLGAQGFSGFGGSALAAQVPPNLRLSTMADGTVLLSSADYGYVAKITPAGTLVKVAGTGALSNGAVGGKARLTPILPVEAVGSGTNVFVGVNVSRPCVSFGFATTCPTAEVRKITADGTLSKLYPAVNNSPALADLAVSPGGTLFFATGTSARLVRIDPATAAVNTVTLPRTVGLQRIAVDSAGYVFGADPFGNVFKVTPWGTAATLATLPTCCGPADVALDGSGNLFVSKDQVIYRFTGVAAAAPGPLPHVTSFSPSAAQVGGAVRIVGTNITGVSTVKFGTVASKSVRVLSATTIEAIVPPGALSGRITVTTARSSAVSTATLRVLAAPTQASAGAAHTCARLADGTAACWGSNASGQLGLGTLVSATTPQLVPALLGVTQVSAGENFSCAVTSASQAKCWGANATGQLGSGNTTPSRSPHTVLRSGLSALTGVSSVSAGKGFACAVLNAGANGTVSCWGANAAGQLGDGSTTQRTRPVTVLTAPGTPLKGVKAVEVGGSTACAVRTSGALVCWGANNQGQLGIGSTANSSFAVQLPLFNGITAGVGSVSVGTNHTCAVASNSKGYCWGLNTNGQLGDGSLARRTSPVAVHRTGGDDLVSVKAIAAGDTSTCAVVATSATNSPVFCWGSDAKGQLGNTSTGVKKVATQVAGTATNRALAVSVGGAHVVVVVPSVAMPQKALVVWGTNASGQLGDGTKAQRSVPLVHPFI